MINYCLVLDSAGHSQLLALLQPTTINKIYHSIDDDTGEEAGIYYLECREVDMVALEELGVLNALDDDTLQAVSE